MISQSIALQPTPRVPVKRGPPEKLTPETRMKLEEAAAIDCSVEEMAYYAGVHRATLYGWLQDNKELSDKIAALRERPVLAARQRAVKGVGESYNNAMDYLSRKRKLEFAHQANLDVTTGGEKLNVVNPLEVSGEQLTEALKAAMKTLSPKKK